MLVLRFAQARELRRFLEPRHRGGGLTLWLLCFALFSTSLAFHCLALLLDALLRCWVDKRQTRLYLLLDDFHVLFVGALVEHKVVGVDLEQP